MSGRSYKASLDALLTPLGFARDGQDWIRVRNGIKETVNLQVSNIAGSTINLTVVDLESARLAHEILSNSGDFYMARGLRIGALIDGYDHWWRRDPDGPTKLTEAVRIHGLPYFDQVSSLEEQAAKWFGRGGSEAHLNGRTLIALVITLYRMGKIEEARAAMGNASPKAIGKYWAEDVEKVRRWLERQGPGG